MAQQTTDAHARLWWPQFDKLYEALREACVSDASSAVHNLNTVISAAQTWLAEGLLGFQPPSTAAKAHLEQQDNVFTTSGKKMPITHALRPLALQLSSHLDLNELQAYILVRRWSAKQTEPASELSSAQLHNLEMEYYKQRTYLLRSLEEMLTQSGTKEYAVCTARAVKLALATDLEAHLIQALSLSLSYPSQRQSASSAGQTGVALVIAPAAASSNSQPQRRKSPQAQQQLVNEQEMLLSLMLSLYSMWRPCTIEPCQQLMQMLNYGFLKAASVQEPVGRTACLAQVLAVHMLQLPALLDALIEGTGLSAKSAPLLATAEGQQALSSVFTAWLGAAKQPNHEGRELAPGHGPALLGFAAAVSLVPSLPDTPEGFVGIDAGEYASLAAQLGVLQQLATLSQQRWTSPVADCVAQTLLNLVSAVITAFELSPFTLPSDQLQATTNILVGLYEGQPELCQAFHDPDDDHHLRHAPARHFYKQVLQLAYQNPKPVLQLWHSLASGANAQDYVAGMMENPLSPTTCHLSQQGLLQLSPDVVQASEAFDVPQLEGLLVPEGSIGQVLPYPEDLPAPNSTDEEGAPFLVLWQSHQSSEDWQPLETNNVLLMQAQASWQRVKQGLAEQHGHEAITANSAYIELLLILSLFARLTDSHALVGQDLLRVRLSRQQQQQQNVDNEDSGMSDDFDCSDALDLACQVIDHLTQAPVPLLELLATSLDLVANLAGAFPGQVARMLPCTALLAAQRDSSSWTGPGLPALQHVQRAWEGRAGLYHVTLAYLKLVNALVTAGVNEPCVKAYVGFCLTHILSSCHAWRYGQRKQRWQIVAAALQVLASALAGPLASTTSSMASGPDWSLAKAVAEALSEPGGSAGYLTPNLPPNAGLLNILMQRNGREEEACALERLAEVWLELIPLLVQACLDLSHPSALLPDLFQMAEGTKQSAANVLASYMGYPFQDPTSITLALQGAGALITACSGHLSGQVSVARCMLGGSAGDTVDGSILAGLTQPFGLDQATADPQRFTAAVQVLIAALKAPHPSLLAVLLGSSLTEQEADKENRSQSANAAPGALVVVQSGEGPKPTAAPNGKPRDKKQTSPTCLDGLRQILQHAGELRTDQPQVLATAMQVLAAMWQAGQGAAVPVSVLRDQPDFLKHVSACFSDKGPAAHSSESVDATDFLQSWEERDDLAWQIMAEAYALDILSVEAFIQPRGKQGESKSAIWQLLEGWGSGGSDWGGQLLQALQRYTQPTWRSPCSLQGQDKGLDEAQALCQELHWEAEAKLMNMLAFITSLDGDDLQKITAGHSFLSSLWAAVRPVMAAHFHSHQQPGTQQDQRHFAQLCNEAFTYLAQRLASREACGPAWEQLAQQACRVRSYGNDSDEEEESVEGQQALLLHDIRQLGLTEALLDVSSAVDSCTTPRVCRTLEGYVLDSQRLEDSVGSLVIIRAGLQSLQMTLFRAVNTLAFLQDAQQQALTSLRALVAVMARSSPQAQPPPLPTPVASQLLDCLRCASDRVATRPELQPQSPPLRVPGMNLALADQEAAYVTAQVVLSQLRHWKPQQLASSLRSPHQAARPGSGLPPTASRHGPSRLNKSSSASDATEEAQAGVAAQLMQLTASWLAQQHKAIQAQGSPTAEALTQCLLTSLVLVLRRMKLDSPYASPSQLTQAALALLPHLCHLVSCLGTLASSAANATGIMLRACHLDPADWAPAVTQHLHLVQALAQAYHTRSLAAIQRQHQGVLQQYHQDHNSASAAARTHQEEHTSSSSLQPSSAVLEGTIEGALLTLAVNLAQSPPGAQLLVEQGFPDLLPQLAKWLLSPAGGGLADVQQTEAGSLPRPSGHPFAEEAQVDFGGMYTPQGQPASAHQQWCALLSLTGVVVRTVAGDGRVDTAVVALLAVAQERMQAVVAPPEATPHQPLTLALLQEVEKVLFLVTYLPGLRGRWQLASLAQQQGGPLIGPLAMRHACCLLLDFAALAVQHQQQPFCPPVSPHEQAMARHKPQLPLAQAWFRVTAVGANNDQSAQLGADDTHDQPAVSASDYSCQVAESMYSCVVLALGLLMAFCPEVQPQEAAQGLGLGWPKVTTMRSLQKQCIALTHNVVSLSSTSRSIALARDVKGCLMLSTQLLRRMHVTMDDRQAKDIAASQQQLQSLLHKL